MGKCAALGIDIGGTKTLCALIDEKFQLIEEIKFKTAPARGRKRFTTKLVGTLKMLQATAAKEGLKLIGTGIGSAGEVDCKACTIKSSPNILYLKKYPIGDILKEELGLPCMIGNDVQMGLYGEHQLGAAIGCAYVLGVFFGTGVGGAAIVNGELAKGANGFGGQVGAILTQPIGGQATAKAHGMIDRMASKAAIGGDALGLASKQWAPHLYSEVGTDLSKITWGVLARSIVKGDTQIEDMIRARMRIVGSALASVVNFLDPEMVVLGGGAIEEMPKLILSEIDGAMREHVVPEIAKGLKIVVAKLKNRAAVFGAAKLAFETFAPSQRSRRLSATQKR